VTLAGQSFARPTTTGALEGTRVLKRIRPRKGVYRFRLGTASAALLTIPRPARR
jgi:hypothetical protein